MLAPEPSSSRFCDKDMVMDGFYSPVFEEFFEDLMDANKTLADIAGKYSLEEGIEEDPKNISHDSGDNDNANIDNNNDDEDSNHIDGNQGDNSNDYNNNGPHSADNNVSKAG
jgi:hypothetical protein